LPTSSNTEFWRNTSAWTVSRSAEPIGEALQALRVAPGEHRRGAGRDQPFGGAPAGVAGGSEDDDPRCCHARSDATMAC
jgi:hypothetical protein